MKNIINWFVNNIVAANLFMILILISGYITLPKILMEIFPAPTLDIISISVPYPGASPEDIEKSICTKIEENIAGIESIKKIRSTALENQGYFWTSTDGNSENYGKSRALLQDNTELLDSYGDNKSNTLLKNSPADDN